MQFKKTVWVKLLYPSWKGLKRECCCPRDARRKVREHERARERVCGHGIENRIYSHGESEWERVRERVIEWGRER